MSNAYPSSFIITKSYFPAGQNRSAHSPPEDTPAVFSMPTPPPIPEAAGPAAQTSGPRNCTPAADTAPSPTLSAPAPAPAISGACPPNPPGISSVFSPTRHPQALKFRIPLPMEISESHTTPILPAWKKCPDPGYRCQCTPESDPPPR